MGEVGLEVLLEIHQVDAVAAHEPLAGRGVERRDIDMRRVRRELDRRARHRRGVDRTLANAASGQQKRGGNRQEKQPDEHGDETWHF